MEAMTSEREAFEKFHREIFGQGTIDPSGALFRTWKAACAWNTCNWQARAHLAQPAQAVDVVAYLAEGTGKPMSREIVDLHFPTDEDKAKARLTPLTRALSGEKAGPVGDGWKGRAAKLLRDLEFSAIGGRRCPCCLGWNDQNGETDRQHTKTCELAALIAAPGKEGEG